MAWKLPKVEILKFKPVMHVSCNYNSQCRTSSKCDHHHALPLNPLCFMLQEFRAKMRPSNSASRLQIARAGSVSSIASSSVYEDTPRADLQTNHSSPHRQLPTRPVTNGVGVSQKNTDMYTVLFSY